ncbi:YraN family protein [Motiliproteus sediminis]|uniref:YraN family protein n=1 Tax=Motiliproteus sediminis TaxID=1468178 RepID=UPI001AEFF443|nr:YraN family protein [Motiliproteus sediminis]
MSRSKGQQQEQLAEAYLIAAGLTPVERNYFCPRGEIDLIMRDQNTLVFVEVRFRRSRGFASAAESVDYRKQQRLVATAEHYLQKHAGRRNPPCRFDVLACDGAADWVWIKNAIDS